MRLVWTRKVLSDYVEIIEYIALDSPTNAALVAERLLNSIDLLLISPRRGRELKRAGLR